MSVSFLQARQVVGIASGIPPEKKQQKTKIIQTNSLIFFVKKCLILNKIISYLSFAFDAFRNFLPPIIIVALWKLYKSSFQSLLLVLAPVGNVIRDFDTSFYFLWLIVLDFFVRWLAGFQTLVFDLQKNANLIPQTPNQIYFTLKLF